MKTLLLQGDSITDAGRDRDNDDRLGNGYPNILAGLLGTRHPGQVRCLNRGVSGNKVTDLYARSAGDIFRLHPDVLTILIGVNDVWHELGWGNGTSRKKFESVYRALLEEVRTLLPDTKILLLGAYVLKGSATARQWDVFSAETAARAEITRKLAQEFGLPFLPLQPLFDEAETKAPGSFWLADGVHPLAPGHALIAEALLPLVEEALEL